MYSLISCKYCMKLTYIRFILGVRGWLPCRFPPHPQLRLRQCWKVLPTPLIWRPSGAIPEDIGTTTGEVIHGGVCKWTLPSVSLMTLRFTFFGIIMLIRKERKYFLYDAIHKATIYFRFFNNFHFQCVESATELWQ